jgi:hypothetical protein
MFAQDIKVYFAIPIAPKHQEGQWERLNDLLKLTIASLRNQTDQSFLALICGHDMPACLADKPHNVDFLKASFARPSSINEARKDKRRKRGVIAAEVRRQGGGYYMYLDADDIIHRDLVRTIRQDNNGVGYLIDAGYALDFANRRIAGIPGVWNKRFDEVCGSSGIIRYFEEDLPQRPFPAPADESLLFTKVKNHTHFAETIIRDGQKLAPIGFPAAIYTINNSINLSNDLVRTEERQQELVEKIARSKIELLDDIKQNFALAKFL